MAPKAKVSGLRKRLTLGECDPVAQAVAGGGANSAEEKRGLIQSLQKTDILENLTETEKKKAGGRRMSLTSKTDQNLKRRQSFEEKDMVAETDGKKAATAVKKDVESMGIGVCCKKGLKPESPNQDSFSVVTVDGCFRLFGVYDGHGPVGHDVSNFARENVVKLFLRSEHRESNPEKALVESFVECQKLFEHLGQTREMDCSMSGSTCTIVYQPIDQKYLIVAHVGDSRAVLAKKKGGKFVAKDLTEDHKPNLPKEKERIEKAGGRVVFDGYFNHRVFTRDGRGGLNMSRAFGDCIAHKAGVTAEPETDRVMVDVTKIETEPHEDVFLLVCSDGVWEFIESQEAVEMAAKFPRAKAQDAAEELAKNSWDRWIEDSDGEVSDDITAIVAYLSPAAA